MNIFIDIRKKFRMTILELLLSSMIYIAVMAIANSTDEEWKHSALNYNSSDCILPLHYEMQFKLYNVYLSGKYKIIIYISITTQNISFHTSLIRIMNPELKRINNEVIYNIKSIHNEDNLTVLNSEDMLLPGIYTLYMEFYIRINEDLFESMYTNEKGDKE